VSFFGLSSLSLDYSLKNKKYHLLVIFISKHIKIKKNCCSSLTAFAFYYACLFGACSIGFFTKEKSYDSKVPSRLLP
jgi:hypothetical protein